MLTYFIKSICGKLILYNQYLNILYFPGFQGSTFKKKKRAMLIQTFFFLRVHSTNVETIWELPSANSTRLLAKTAIEGK